MKTIPIRTAKTLLFALVLLLAALPVTAESIFPYPVHNEVLDNGLRVILVPMESNGLASYYTIVRTGSRDEYEANRTGFAHFFEHMMFRGTERYPAEVYNGKVTEIGADANAYTTDDLTAYYLNIAASDLETVMDIESDRFQRLAYAKEQFETEAGAVYGEYRMNRTNPFFTLYEGMREVAFTEHTYGHTTMGYEEDIKIMPTLYDYSLSFFERHYRPENIIVFIVGDIEVEPTMEMAKQYYGAWQQGYVEPTIPVEPEQTEERRVEVEYEGSSLPIVWLAYKTPAFDAADPTYLAADLLSGLAFGQTSDLYKKLVIEEQVVEFIQANLNYNRDPGTFDVIARVKDPAKVDYVIEQIDQTVARYQTEAADEQRLADLKSRRKF
ncbi:MAG: pitrilysin family protein [Acidobacteriota bacterium]